MTCFGMVTTAKSGRYTLPALDSFLHHTPLSPDDRIILIDNDGDFVLPASFAAVELVRRLSPHGFAANVNLVLRQAAAQKQDLVFLNNDMIFTSNWLAPLRASDDAILVPLCNQNIPYTHDGLALRPRMHWEEYAGHETALQAVARAHAENPGFRGLFCRPSRISFFCFRLPHAVHEAVGLFDENFGPGGGEDIDYRLRALQAGFDVAFAMQSYVLHFMGKSTWDSGETERDTRSRDAIYVRHFRAKWGDELARLFLFGDDAEQKSAIPGVDALMEAEDYRGVIALCRASRPPAAP